MKIAIGCDHAGFALKEVIKEHLTHQDCEVTDAGTYSADSVDYPDFVHPVARLVGDHEVDFGILICGTGNGVAMTANKYAGVRCGLCWIPEVATLIRAHNNANALAIPARFTDNRTALEIVDQFLESKFEGGRHARRVGKIVPDMGYSC